MQSTVGSVACMKWTPDGTALALAWQHGGVSLWSVFGSLLVCTVGGDFWWVEIFSVTLFLTKPLNIVIAWHQHLCRCLLALYHRIPTFNDPKEEGFGKHCRKRRKCW